MKLRLRIKEVAKEKGMSMMALTRESYVALTTLRQLYRDPYSSVTTDTLQRIARALECSVFDLMEEVPDDTAEKEKGPQT